MMADFMNQHMTDDMPERLVIFGPIIQNWSAIEPDHVGHRRDFIAAAKRQPDALKQSKQIEFAFGFHGSQNFLRWKVLNA